MKFNTFGLVGSDTLPDDVAAFGTPIVDGQLKDTSATLEGLKKDTDTQKKSGRYSENGLREELVRLGEIAFKKIEKDDLGRVRYIDKKLTDENAPTSLPSPAMVIASKKVDRQTIDALSHWLRGLDPLVQQQEITEAINNGDEILLASVENFHPKLRPISHKMWIEATQKYIDHHAPQNLLLLKGLIQSNFATSKGVIKKLTSL